MQSEVRVEELIKKQILQIGDGYRAKNDELIDSGIPFIRAGDLNGFIDTNTKDYLPEDYVETLGVKASQPHDCVFTSKGTVGRLAYVEEHHVQCAYSPQLCYWRSLDIQIIDPRWLYYWMSSREFLGQLYGLQGQTDMADYVSLRDQKHVKLRLPPIQQQRSIGAILSTLDQKIDLLRRQNATLEAMAQTLFRSWFVDFDPVIDKALAAGRELPEALAGRVAKRRKVLAHDHYPRLPEEVMALFPDRFVFSEELGKWVPEGWEVKPLTQIAKYQNGLALQKFRPDSEDDNFLPVLKISHLRQGYTDSKERARTDIKESCRVKDGDIIFSWSGSLLVRVWTGGVAALNQHLFKVTSKKFPKWLYYLYTQHHLNNFIHIAESKAVTMGHIKRGHLEEALCVLPSNEVIKRCGMVINPMIEQVISNGLASNNLTNLRDTILPPLISGKLSVENLITAEGAPTN